MFSANENLMLREHKRRVVNYIEETIPEEALDYGTTVMVMQTACRTPGCVPLETAVAIVFPRAGAKSTTAQKEWIPGLKESAGGTFKTKILMPLSEVTNEDVLDALPPDFKGGRKTWERTCLSLRDIVLGRIGGLVGSGDSEAEVEERKILAEYIREAMGDYLRADCVAPDLGQLFENKMEVEAEIGNSVQDSNPNIQECEDANSILKSGAEVVQGSMRGSGNFVVRRHVDRESSERKREGTITSSINASLPIVPSKQKSSEEVQPKRSNISNLAASKSLSSPGIINNKIINSQKNRYSESAGDWRRRQNMTQSVQIGSSSDNILQRLSDREHAPGVRSPGCPCCDPDNIVNIVDGLLL